MASFTESVLLFMLLCGWVKSDFSVSVSQNPVAVQKKKNTDHHAVFFFAMKPTSNESERKKLFLKKTKNEFLYAWR